MNEIVTLELPKHVVRSARAVAERTHRRVEEVIDLRVLEGITDQGRLACLPRTQEEMGPLREQSGQVEQAGDPPRAWGIDFEATFLLQTAETVSRNPNLRAI